LDQKIGFLEDFILEISIWELLTLLNTLGTTVHMYCMYEEERGTRQEHKETLLGTPASAHHGAWCNTVLSKFIERA
jgi:hypothetical protein